MSDLVNHEGGSGGTTVRVTRLIERAIRERWAVPEDVRALIVPELAKVIRNKRASHRNKISAAKVILQADALNLAQELADSRASQLLSLPAPCEEVTDADLRDGLFRLASTPDDPPTPDGGTTPTPEIEVA